MQSFGIVILITVLWYPNGLAPTVDIHTVKSLPVCEKLVENFYIDAELSNSSLPYPLWETPQAWCELRLSGGDRS